MPQEQENQIILSARELLAGSYRGVLATHSLECPGHPFGSLLPYSLHRDGCPLILVSHLAKHTRNLVADPRCSLTIAEQHEGDTQKLTRLSCLADASPLTGIDRRAAERHFRLFPESRGYYQELNFHFYSLQPVRFYCVAGFGAARWIGVDRLLVKNPFSYKEEEELLSEINTRFGSRLQQRLVHRIASNGPLLAVGLDATGLDLRQDDRMLRLSLPASTSNSSEYLSILSDWL